MTSPSTIARRAAIHVGGARNVPKSRAASCSPRVLTRIINKPGWVDHALSDATAARDFYSKLFGWTVEVNEDPQYGGYALARIGGQDAAGIGPLQSPDQPTVWNVYIGTDDFEGLSTKV